MKRREFLITTSLASANPYSFDWLTGDYKSRQENNISFLVERSSQGMLFPRPPDGHSLNISPPGFCWYPAPGASDYIIRISDDVGKILYEKHKNDFDDKARYFSELHCELANIYFRFKMLISLNFRLTSMYFQSLFFTW